MEPLARIRLSQAPLSIPSINRVAAYLCLQAGDYSLRTHPIRFHTPPHHTIPYHPSPAQIPSRTIEVGEFQTTGMFEQRLLQFLHIESRQVSSLFDWKNARALSNRCPERAIEATVLHARRQFTRQTRMCGNDILRNSVVAV